MTDSLHYSEKVAEHFRAEGPPPPDIVRVLQQSVVAVTRVDEAAPAGAITGPKRGTAACSIAVQLRDLTRYRLWIDAESRPSETPAQGGGTVDDLDRENTAVPEGQIDCIQFYVKRSAIGQIMAEHGLPGCREPGVTQGVPANDLAIGGLAGGMLPAPERRSDVDDPFLDHVAFVLRIADQHDAGRPRGKPLKGGLAPWQLRRAEEIIEAHLDGEVPLARVAAECGLSVGYFARAFARSTGKPPHRWLMARRVERAKELLLSSALSIAEVALGCGFADQAHFTRVFAASVGTAPGRWRRSNRT
jgi:AraC family transcriptional regulator